MSRMPRFLPVLVVVVGGVLAARAASGAADLPGVLAGAKAWAEEAAPAIAAKADAEKEKAQSPLPPGTSIMPPAKVAPLACAPTAAELARQAGLSPAELQVLQSLGVRRGQLEDREKDMDVQLALMAAAEAKLDAKIKTMNGLKTDIQGLVGQAEAQKQAEQDRLVRVYETMKPKDAAARVTILDDAVRLPIAAKMKDRALSAILAQMPPQEAKALTEKLSNRLAAAEAARQAIANPPPAPAPKPAPPAAAKAPTAPAAAPATPAPAAQASADSPKPAPRPRPKPRPKAQARAPAKPAAKPETKPAATAAAPAAAATPAAAAPAGPPPAPAAAPATSG